MAFVVQCPFCKLQAKVPDRANGEVGRCPKCASSFTLASADDRHLPEVEEAPIAAAEAEVERVSASAVNVAIAIAAAAVADARPIDSPHDLGKPAGFQPGAAAGALALFLSGLALICSSISALFGLVLPLSALALFVGLAAVGAACLTKPVRLLLPAAGSAAGAALLLLAWLFPALLGLAYQYATRRPDPVPAGLHAIPLAGAPELKETPEWVDAKRYALRRDGLRVQVVRVSLLPPAATDAAKERLLVRVRVSLARADAKPLERRRTQARRSPTTWASHTPCNRANFSTAAAARTRPPSTPFRPSRKHSSSMRRPRDGKICVSNCPPRGGAGPAISGSRSPRPLARNKRTHEIGFRFAFLSPTRQRGRPVPSSLARRAKMQCNRKPLLGAGDRATSPPFPTRGEYKLHLPVTSRLDIFRNGNIMPAWREQQRPPTFSTPSPSRDGGRSSNCFRGGAG